MAGEPSTQELEAQALALSRRIQVDLLTVLERWERVHGDSPTFNRYIGAHAIMEVLGRALEEMQRVDPERGRRWCAETLAQLQLFVNPASSRTH